MGVGVEDFFVVGVGDVVMLCVVYFCFVGFDCLNFGVGEVYWEFEFFVEGVGVVVLFRLVGVVGEMWVDEVEY